MNGENQTYPKVYWAEKDFEGYLKNKSILFHNNIRCDKNDKDESKYDGLIVALSGHGIQHHK